MILQNYLTERLRFRCLTPDDKDLLLEFFSDATATAYLPMSQNIEDYVDSWLKRQMRRYDAGNGGWQLLFHVLFETIAQFQFTRKHKEK